ncbi:MAG: hypothetical protein WCK27_15185 [Verrucomicrobiota bacterium]
MSRNHIWKFFRAGGFDQVRLDTGADLMALDQLDQKLWVALACPTTGLEFDKATLALIDTDKDGRIRATEVIAATQWAGSCLKNPDELLKSSPALPLAAFNDATPEGKQLLASAKQILATLKKADATAVTVEDASQVAEKFVETVLNGDGIIIPETAKDDATKQVINDIIAGLGSDVDRSGKPGINQARVDQFFADAQAFSDWHKKAEADTAVLPLGDATAGAAAAVKAVQTKVDDYFTRCQLAAFDPRASNALNREEKDYLAFAAKDLTITNAEIAGFPLARVEAGRPLPLTQSVNPAWADAIAKFQNDAVKPLLGDRNALTEADWGELLAKLGPYEGWSAGLAGGSVAKLGRDRVRQVLASTAKDTLTKLIAEDKSLEPQFTSIAAVEKLARYHRDLYKLLNNFVSFRDFYGRKDKAIFQAGTLYLDQRSCDLCLTVEDGARHALLAGLSGTYLAYCDCVRKATGEKLQIVAAFTSGDSDNLMVGRNGIFYDRKGRDWDATITKIIENPISIPQAFWAPYKKVVRMIEEQVAKRAAAADAVATQKLELTATTVVNADPTKPPPPPAPQPPKTKMDTGTLAAIGLVLTTLLAALGGIFGAIAKLPPWQVPLAILGILLAISLPSMLLAWLKLRRRNLGPILDANGWAVNAKAKMNVPFGGSLTGVAALPPGSQRDLVDPFAEQKSPWPKIIVFAFVLVLVYVALNGMGYIYDWTNGRIGDPKPSRVERAAPAAPTETPAKPAETAK